MNKPISLLMCCLVLGCQTHKQSEEQYVKANNCVATGELAPQQMFYDGQIHTSGGLTIYHCPNGVIVVIHGEDKP
jgi:hypothetical protein